MTYAKSLQEALVEVYQIIQLSNVQLSFSRVEGGEELLADRVYTLEDWTHDVRIFLVLSLNFGHQVFGISLYPRVHCEKVSILHKQ